MKAIQQVSKAQIIFKVNKDNLVDKINVTTNCSYKLINSSGYHSM